MRTPYQILSEATQTGSPLLNGLFALRRLNYAFAQDTVDAEFISASPEMGFLHLEMNIRLTSYITQFNYYIVTIKAKSSANDYIFTLNHDMQQFNLNPNEVENFLLFCQLPGNKSVLTTTNTTSV